MAAVLEAEAETTWIANEIDASSSCHELPRLRGEAEVSASAVAIIVVSDMALNKCPGRRRFLDEDIDLWFLLEGDDFAPRQEEWQSMCISRVSYKPLTNGTSYRCARRLLSIPDWPKTQTMNLV